MLLPVSFKRVSKIAYGYIVSITTGRSMQNNLHSKRLETILI